MQNVFLSMHARHNAAVRTMQLYVDQKDCASASALATKFVSSTLLLTVTAKAFSHAAHAYAGMPALASGFTEGVWAVQGAKPGCRQHSQPLHPMPASLKAPLTWHSRQSMSCKQRCQSLRVLVFDVCCCEESLQSAQDAVLLQSLLL